MVLNSDKVIVCVVIAGVLVCLSVFWFVDDTIFVSTAQVLQKRGG